MSNLNKSTSDPCKSHKCDIQVIATCILCSGGMSTFRTGKSSKKARSKSQRAGTVFPVSRLSRQLKATSPHHRLGVAAPVYLAAVIEYLSGSYTSRVDISTCL